MKASLIPEYELSFRTSGMDSGGKKFTLTESNVLIPGSAESLKLTDCVLQNKDKSFYYEELVSKEKIVLHFTAGFLKGDIATLTKKDNHVSVPFVIARSGEIFNLWSSKYWSYHLGPAAIGGNKTMSSKCIGIEISNIGPLDRSGNDLLDTYKKPSVYCSLNETQFYTKTARYRQKEYFATYTPEQYKSLKLLLKFLTAKYNIPYNIMSEAKRYNVFTAAEAKAYKGICSHVNFRKDKWDIGPAFDWSKIL